MFLEAISWGRIQESKGQGNPITCTVSLRLGMTTQERSLYVGIFSYVARDP